MDKVGQYLCKVKLQVSNSDYVEPYPQSFLFLNQ